jgi:catechol 2,3-dioxygenase
VFAPADDHHHIALNTFGLKPAGPAPPGLSGVYHFALLYPKPEALIDAVERLRAHHYPIGYGSDHGGSVSIHLEDPDGNGIELYWDRPGGPRVDASGNHMVRGERFDPADLRSVLERPVCRPAA